MVKAKRNEATNGYIESRMLLAWQKEREEPVRNKRKFDDIVYITDLEFKFISKEDDFSGLGSGSA